MMRGKKLLFLLVAMAVMLSVMGCKENAQTGTADNETTAAEQQTTAPTGPAKETKATKKTKKKEAEKKKAEKKTKEAKKAKKAKKTAKKTETKASGKSGATTSEAKTKKPSGHVLTVKKGSKVKYYTESDLKNLGTVSYRYSFRNKDSSHRQFGDFSGVKLTSLLNNSGFSGSSMLVTCKDGYAKRYSLSELKASKKAFKKKVGNSSNSAPAIITVSGSEAFRLCFGQASGDSDDQGDYNMQYWAKNITTIQIQ